MLITNFAAGELSQTLNGRTDIPQYYQSAGFLQNFDILPTGGIARRVGTERIASLTGDCRLIPFVLNKDISFVFECRPAASGSVMLVWKNGVKMTGAGGTQVAIASPWKSLSEIREVQYAQNYDVMIFVQRGHAPFQIQYDIGRDSFTSGTMSFDFTPDVELDDDYGMTYVSDAATLPTTNTFDAKSYRWLIWRGKLYEWNAGKMVWEEDTSAPEYEAERGLFTTENNYPGTVAFFNSRLYFGGTNNHRQKIWASASPDIKGTRYNSFSTYIKYVTVNKYVTDPDIHFFTGNSAANGTVITDVTQDLTKVSDIQKYYVTGSNIPVGTKVLSVTWDAGKKKGTVSLSASVTAEGKAQVYSIQKWPHRTSASASDYEFTCINNNMTAPDCSFHFEIASDQNDAIKWLATSRYLVIGTESGDYVVPSGVTALQQQVYMDGRYGSDDMQATAVGNAVIFLSQGKKAIREYYYSSEDDAFRSNNIAIMNPEMLSESAAYDFDFMTNPYSRIIITREDGKAAVLLYEKNHGVMGWTRFVPGNGRITSVAVVRGRGGCDIAYFTVDHDGRYYLEKLDMETDVYLDSRQRYTGNEEVLSGYTDEAVLYNRTKKTVIRKPELTAEFYESGDEAYIGYAYESRIQSMPVVSQDVTGKKRIVKLLVRFYKSSKPELTVTGKPNETFTDFTEPYSGIKEIDYPGDSDRDVTFTFTTRKPEPCNILAVHARLAQ